MRNRSDHGPRMIRPWSENDPTTHETVSHPSHRRGRSSTFGDALCLEKHRVSCICSLKNAFRARLPSKLHRQFIHQHQLQSHLHCGIRGRTLSGKTQGFVHLLSLKNAFRARLPSKLHRQLIHQHHLQSHLHCGNNPTVANHNGILSTAHARKTLETPFTMRNRSDHGPRMIRPWSENDPTTHETVSHPSHRRGRSSTFGDALCLEKHRVSCICYLSKTYFVRNFLQNSIGNSSTSTTCNPIYIAGTILQLQTTMEFCRPRMHEKHLKPHLQCGTDPTMVRDRSDHDPPMIRPHTRPSRNRRTAEVDHRGSGTDFVWKNIGFRASAISQKRISCETSSKTPSATPPPAPLAIPFTLRERSYSCKPQWNSVDRACTKNT